ncbi:MAG: hypothetical protein HY055_02110 [Magnetospirillum sp.]|nr:hypothetical protein [Magnetospirillum sp.]
MPRLPAFAALCLALGGCSLVSPDKTADELRANADRHVSQRIALSPTNACAKVARMLSWCARGPNYHYRCSTIPNGSRSELTGVLEAVYRSEVFLVVDFVKAGSDTDMIIHQRESMLIYDYPPMIETYLSGKLDCQPG